MEEMKAKLERLPEMEKTMECLTQGLARVLYVLEITNTSVHSIRNSNPANKNPIEKDNSKRKILVEDRQAQDQLKIGVSAKNAREKESSRGGVQLKALDEPIGILAPVIVEGLDSHSTNSGRKARLMKLKGRIGRKEVVVLIKSGATDNFISRELAEDLQLPKTQTREYTVEMCHSGDAKGHSIYMGVTLEMPGLTIVEDFLPLKLMDNVDVILGMKWLRTLGMVMHNFGGLHRMKFRKGDDMIEWTADPNL